MNKCTQSDIQEMLPDLLHNTLGADARARVEAHLASCGVCREDMEVLRTIKSAAVFAPAIDVDRVVRQIPPYRSILPATERPISTRIVSWLVAASLAVVVIGGGSLVLKRPRVTNPPSAAVTVQQPHALALAANVDDLSDGNLVQLMNEMSRFDALPASEPDPIISVDSGYNLEQDLR